MILVVLALIVVLAIGVVVVGFVWHALGRISEASRWER